MQISVRLRTFLQTHRRTCTSLGVSVLIHALLLAWASMGNIQSPESNMGTSKTLSVTITSGTKAPAITQTPLTPPPPRNKKNRMAPPSPKATTAAKTGTFNMAVAHTYQFKAEAQAPANNAPENTPKSQSSDTASAATSTGPSAPHQAESPGTAQNTAGTGQSPAGTNSRPDYLENPAPTYPALARRLGQEGTVLLRVDVDTKGNPTRVSLQKSSGFPLLDNTAIQSVKRWKFKPAQVAFFAVSATVDVPITFRLSPEP